MSRRSNEEAKKRRRNLNCEFFSLPPAMMAQSNYSLALTVPFVNFLWLTDLFDWKEACTAEDGSGSTSQQLTRLLTTWASCMPDTPPPPIFQALAGQLDRYQSRLSARGHRQRLGLVNEADVVGLGYGLKGAVAGGFVELFSTAVVLDRMLSTKLSSCIMTQYRHPYTARDDFFGHFDNFAASEKRHRSNLEHLAMTLEIVKSDGLSSIKPISAEAMVVHTAMLTSGATLAGNYGYIYQVIANVCIMAVAMLILANVSLCTPPTRNELVANVFVRGRTMSL
jgi:hypothetical protein